jgi:antitoxin FitA
MSKVIQVRDVPDDIHALLVKQAKAKGMSLNQFILREYQQIADRGRNAEIFRRAAARPGRRLTTEQIVGTLREDRGRDD